VGEIRQGGEQVQASAAELSRLAEQLKALVGQFKIDTVMSEEDKAGILTSNESAEAVLIPWTEELSVQVLSMDAQHKQLIGLINKLHAALKRGQGAAATGTILKELIQYTEYHFSAEEKLMDAARYSDLPAQRQAHALLVDKAKDAEQRWAAGDSRITQELMNLLYDWLPQHIVGMDKKYGPYLRG